MEAKRGIIDEEMLGDVLRIFENHGIEINGTVLRAILTDGECVEALRRSDRVFRFAIPTSRESDDQIGLMRTAVSIIKELEIRVIEAVPETRQNEITASRVYLMFRNPMTEN